jgi:hypothetical protein
VQKAVKTIAARAIALALLVCLGSVHAAPLFGSLQPVKSCCRKKSTCCCKKLPPSPDRVGLRAAAECAKSCKVSTVAKIPFGLSAPSEQSQAVLPRSSEAAGVTSRSHSISSAYLAFLYQRPPPSL